ncbi:MAG: cell division ATP-binding protein FtsE [Clostridia bacterium]|nr:cell division ATP-binding protein FtsE [Clostridia bacterium]
MVELNSVSKTYGKTFEALKNVNLTINDGEFVFVVGASGAGKSTFLKLIMREEVPTSGTVTINGYNLNKMKKRDVPYFRRTMGIVFQDFRLIPDMRVYDNVAFALRVTGTKEREVRKRVSHALGMVGLLPKAQSLPNELSGGEQQRVAIARALVNNADLIIADEPTGNIDPAMATEIMDLLNHINKANGTTVVMVTHAHDLVRQYDHRIVVLKEGQIIADGYDKEKMLHLINPDTPSSDAGFYNAPNEFNDVENFISHYGEEDAPLEDTIPEAPEQEEVKAETVVPATEEIKELAEEIISAVEEDKKSDTPYSVANDKEISSILAAFAASNASRLKKAKDAVESAKEAVIAQEETEKETDNQADTSAEAEDENGGDGLES